MKTYTTRVVEVTTTDEEGRVLSRERTTTTDAPTDQPQRQAIDEVFEEVDKVFEHVDSIFTKAAKLFKRVKG